MVFPYPRAFYITVAVVGLSYVGLLLIMAFTPELTTTGFDNDVSRVEQLQAGSNRNREVDDLSFAIASTFRSVTTFDTYGKRC